jgi:hypothetical protein
VELRPHPLDGHPSVEHLDDGHLIHYRSGDLVITYSSELNNGWKGRSGFWKYARESSDGSKVAPQHVICMRKSS